MNDPFTNLTNDVIQLRIAAQLAPRRQRRELDRLRSDLESGQEWPQAISRLQKRQPALGNLLAAALAAGHPAAIIMILFQRRAVSRLSFQQFLTALIYPLCLLVAALVLGSLLSMTMLSMATTDWQDTFMNPMITGRESSLAARAREFQDASIGTLMVLGWCAALAIGAYWLAAPSAWLKLVSGVPVLGRIYRWLNLSELLNRISVFSQYQPSLDKTLALTEQSFGKHALGPISHYLGEAIARGEALPNALHQTIVSDSRAGMALTLIDPHDLSDSTLRASRLVDEMIKATCNQLRLILPPLIVMVVVSVVWGSWSYYFELMMDFRRLFYW